MFTKGTRGDCIFHWQPVYLILIQRIQRRPSDVYNSWDEGAT